MPEVTTSPAGAGFDAARLQRLDDHFRSYVDRGALDGTRILAPRTVRLMTENHLPEGRDLGALATGGFAETTYDGIGFGLGFAVVVDPRPSKTLRNPGEYYWGGFASTAFWVDPVDEITAHFFTQLLPSTSYPIRAQLRQLVYSAMT